MPSSTSLISYMHFYLYAYLYIGSLFWLRIIPKPTHRPAVFLKLIILTILSKLRKKQQALILSLDFHVQDYNLFKIRAYSSIYRNKQGERTADGTACGCAHRAVPTKPMTFPLVSSSSFHIKQTIIGFFFRRHQISKSLRLVYQIWSFQEMSSFVCQNYETQAASKILSEANFNL